MLRYPFDFLSFPFASKKNKNYHNYFQKRFSLEIELRSFQFNAYLADLQRLEATEAARCPECIIAFQLVLKTVGTDKSLGVDRLLYFISEAVAYVYVLVGDCL